MFGDKLKARREEKGLSQDDVADFFGENFSRQAVSKWERGLSVPDAGMLVRIAGALDTTVNDLLGEEEPEQGRDLAAELEALNRQLGRPPVGTVAAPAADGGRGPGGGGGTVEDPEKIERRTR